MTLSCQARWPNLAIAHTAMIAYKSQRKDVETEKSSDCQFSQNHFFSERKRGGLKKKMKFSMTRNRLTREQRSSKEQQILNSI